MNFKKLSAALIAAALVGVSGAASAAALLTFDPSAANGDAVNKTVYAGQGAFSFTSIQTSLVSQLDINALSGATNWQESGNLIFNTYDLGFQYGGNRTYGPGMYDIYGIFKGAGGGVWAANTFTVNSISTFSIDVYASPATGGALTVATPTSGTQANGGISAGSSDFKLGTAVFAGSFGGTNAQLNPSNNTATEQLTANFFFTPASSAYVGVGGFFAAPSPFNLVLNASGSSNSGQSTYTVDGTGVHIVTSRLAGATGNITADINKVPEPTALSLVGLALVGVAVASRKKKSQNA